MEVSIDIRLRHGTFGCAVRSGSVVQADVLLLLQAFIANCCCCTQFGDFGCQQVQRISRAVDLKEVCRQQGFECAYCYWDDSYSESSQRVRLTVTNEVKGGPGQAWCHMPVSVRVCREGRLEGCQSCGWCHANSVLTTLKMSHCVFNTSWRRSFTVRIRQYLLCREILDVSLDGRTC